MPFCPKCKYEYREGIKRCPDCDLPLRAHLREESEPEPMEDAWVVVATAPNEMEARVIRSVLEAAGIPVWERADIVTALNPLGMGPLPEESIAVPESRVDYAKKALRDARKR